MANLKDLKNRISSVKSTRKITKAMQMVAASKLRRAEEAVASARPYAEKFDDVMAGLAANVQGSDNAPKLMAGTGDAVHLLVVMTSERGLAGGFNTNIVKKARSHAADLEAQGKIVRFLTVGKKGREQLKREFADKIVDHVDLSEVKKLGYQDAKSIADGLLARFEAEEANVVTMFYSRYESVISQVPTAQQIIPVTVETPEGEVADAASVDVDYEPDEGAILTQLLPRGVATQVFAALLENTASEHGARMSAMDNATRNADDMIDGLTIEYNRTRQAVITNELIEIISGAEAL